MMGSQIVDYSASTGSRTSSSSVISQQKRATRGELWPIAGLAIIDDYLIWYFALLPFRHFQPWPIVLLPLCFSLTRGCL